MKEKLSPCPFCGSLDLEIEKDLSEDNRIYAYHVRCKDCQAKGGNMFPISWCENDTMAIERWNDRAHGSDFGRSIGVLQSLVTKIKNDADTIKRIAEYIEKLPVVDINREPR